MLEPHPSLHLPQQPLLFVDTIPLSILWDTYIANTYFACPVSGIAHWVGTIRVASAPAVYCAAFHGAVRGAYGHLQQRQASSCQTQEALLPKLGVDVIGSPANLYPWLD